MSVDNTRNDDAFLGLFTAAGFARRLGALDGSKELIKVPDVASVKPNTGSARIAVGDYLVRQYVDAGINNLLIIRREEKHDIPAHYQRSKNDGVFPNLTIIDHVTEATPSTCHSIDSAWQLLKDRPVAMGFPDMLIQPFGIFDQLRQQFAQDDSDICIALFPATDPNIWDMVSYDCNTCEVTHISVKPGSAVTGISWGCALWRPSFSRFLHDTVASYPTDVASSRELYAGSVIQAAIEHGLRVTAVPILNGSLVDIGTPSELRRIQQMR